MINQPKAPIDDPVVLSVINDQLIADRGFTWSIEPGGPAGANNYITGSIQKDGLSENVTAEGELAFQ